MEKSAIEKLKKLVPTLKFYSAQDRRFPEMICADFNEKYAICIPTKTQDSGYSYLVNEILILDKDSYVYIDTFDDVELLKLCEEKYRKDRDDINVKRQNDIDKSLKQFELLVSRKRI